MEEDAEIGRLVREIVMETPPSGIRCGYDKWSRRFWIGRKRFADGNAYGGTLLEALRNASGSVSDES